MCIDGHVHFTKPECEGSLRAGRDDSPWVNSDYRGKTLADFIREHPEYDGDYLMLDIVGTLKSAGFPPSPHVVDKIYQAMAGNGIHGFVLLTIDYPGSTQPAHEEMLRLVEAFPHTIIGSVSVDPNSENAANRLYARLRKLVELNEKIGNGCRPVVKMHPLQQKFDPGDIGRMGRMYTMMEEMGAVLVTHTGVFQRAQVEGDIVIADPARLREVAERHPKLRIVLAHMGTPDIVAVNYWEGHGVKLRHFENALGMVVRFPNVYGDMGGLLWFGDKPGGVYGEGESRNYYFGDRAQFAFSKIKGILEREGRSLWKAGLRAFGLGKNQLHRKLIYGSGFPATGKDDLERQIMKLGGFNPAKNTARVFARA